MNKPPSLILDAKHALKLVELGMRQEALRVLTDSYAHPASARLAEHVATVSPGEARAERVIIERDYE